MRHAQQLISHSRLIWNLPIKQEAVQKTYLITCILLRAAIQKQHQARTYREVARKRFRRYPERILADKSYRSRKTREYCKEHGIRISGTKLGKPKADNSADIAMELKEIGKRNEVEGKFGTAKRSTGLT